MNEVPTSLPEAAAAVDLLSLLIPAGIAFVSVLVGAWLGAHLSKRGAISIERERQARAKSGARALIFRECAFNLDAVARLEAQLGSLPPERPEGETMRLADDKELFYRVSSLDVAPFREAALQGFVQELPHAFSDEHLNRVLDFYEGVKDVLARARRLPSELPAAPPIGGPIPFGHPAGEVNEDAFRRIDSVASAARELRGACQERISAGNQLIEEMASLMAKPPTIAEVMALGKTQHR